MSSNEKYLKKLFKVDQWKIIQDTFFTNKKDQEIANSIMSLANEYMGFRGYFEEEFDNINYHHLFINGIWYPNQIINNKKDDWEYYGLGISVIDYLAMKININGINLNLANQKPETFERILNMQEGILYRNFTVSVNKKKISINSERIVSIVNPEWALIKYELTALSSNINITWSSYLKINPDVDNNGETFCQALQYDDYSLWVKTRSNTFNCPEFIVYGSMINIFDKNGESSKNVNNKEIEHRFTFKLNKNEKITLYKYVFIQTTRNYPESDILSNKFDNIIKLTTLTYEKHKKNHIEKWAERWKQHDIIISGDDVMQQAMRFNVFQVLCSYYGQDENLTLNTNGLTAKKYYLPLNSEFEVSAFPYYLCNFQPNVAKNLLLYRYYQLPQAYKNAQYLNLKGAFYPQLTFNGLESNNSKIIFQQLDHNIAIVYAIYCYINYTGDEDFLKKYGLEMLIAVSKFFVDRIHYNEKLGKFIFHNVAGRNQYDININNNWYINYGIYWSLNYCLSLFDQYKFDQIMVSEREKNHWRKIVKNIYLPVDEKKGLFLQHDDFLIKNIEFVRSLKTSDRPLYKKWSWDQILRSCYISQSDVLQALYLFQDNFNKDVIKNNYYFYEQITVHETDTSRIAPAILATHLKLKDESYHLLMQNCRFDLDNYNDNTEEGLHMLTMGGSWLILVYGFANLKIKDGLSLDPIIPEQWDSYQFNIIFDQRNLAINVSKKVIKITLLKGLPIKISIYNQKHLLKKTLNVSKPDNIN